MKERSIRNLLLELGVGQFSATMVTQNMFQAPAVSDPKSPHIIIVVGHLQDKLNQLGFGLARTKKLDQPTADALAQVVGPQWERRTWADVIARVLAAVRVPGAYAAADRTRAAVPPERVTFAGITDVPFGLPDVPGGLITYGALGFFLWRYLKKRKG